MVHNDKRPDNPHILVFGAGAVGGYVGGHLARSGRQVTLVDPWSEHIEVIRRDGVHVTGTQGDYRVPVRALHVADVQSLTRLPIDIAIIATKSFDTMWAARLLSDYLSPSGYIVSMQNSINEPSIASIVGWPRTIGCVLSTIGVSTVGPGHLTRHRTPGDSEHPVFRVGEVHGRVTPRAEHLSSILQSVDQATVTTNLWGERWSKLITNAMQMGLLGASGLCNEEIINDPQTRDIIIRAASEGISVARALGYDLEEIVSVEAEAWLDAAKGEATSKKKVEQALFAYLDRQTVSGRRGYGSLGRDIRGGRRCEIDFVNGLISDKADEIGIQAPVHRALANIVKSIERGDLTPCHSNIMELIR